MNAIHPAWAIALLILCSRALAAEPFRTDINPALLYHQAFLVMPEHDEEDRDFLFTTDWRARTMDERGAALLAGYDNTFKLLRRAALARVPCDWGLDLVDGPGALLPWLARAKALTQVATLRARLALQEGREPDARDDLLAVFVLGRNLSRDTVLISALVQIAIENIVTSFVAQNFHRFEPAILEQIAAGYETAPARGTILQCIPTEGVGFAGWLIRQIHESVADHPGDTEATLNRIREVCRSVFTTGDTNADFGERLIQAAGGTPEGVIRYARQLDPLYDELSGVLRLPWVDYARRSREFSQTVETHPNLLVGQFFPALETCRGKEFNSLVREAMLRAAVEYRLRGEAGLRKVMDPCGDGPFAFRRVELEGQDRGFELKSTLDWRGFQEVLIFVEKAGPAFYVDGPRAGQPITP